MTDQLQQHIQKLITISAADLALIPNYFRPIEVAKKEDLLREGQLCKENYFVVTGCLRLFFISDTGVEHTIQFALENWWLSDYAAFATGEPSVFGIQAVELSHILAITRDDQEAMLARIPVMERYFRKVHERVHAATQFRMKVMYGQSREELYRDFSRRFPAFVQRVPQYLLASYLGFTPQYLSQIRKKRIS